VFSSFCYINTKFRSHRSATFVQSYKRASFSSPIPARARNYFLSPIKARKSNLPSYPRYAQLRDIDGVAK